jgi:hypothetical protein
MSRLGGGPRQDGAVGVETAVWRALAVFRLLGLVYAVALYSLRYDEYAHPVGGWLVLAAMVAWTVVTAMVYHRPSGRTRPLLVLDLAIAAAAVLATLFLDDPDRIASGAATLPYGRLHRCSPGPSGGSGPADSSRRPSCRPPT